MHLLKEKARNAVFESSTNLTILRRALLILVCYYRQKM